MNILVPNYYHKFKCIADKCNHNCCIGWEIGIDSDTLTYYNALKGEMGEKIRANITYTENTAHFTLKEDNRCPFLNDAGLCDIISTLGEDAICGICTDHPRFRNFYEDFIEMGIGLCCEEAARVILSETEPFSLVAMEVEDEITVSEEEELFLNLRDELFDVIKNRNETIMERFLKLGSRIGLDFKELDLAEISKKFLELERLDNEWTKILENLLEYNFGYEIFCDDVFFLPFEQLLAYFMFRHLSDAIEDGMLLERIRFVLVSCYLIGAILEWRKYAGKSVDVSCMAEIARMYSSEVEYSESNLRKILEIL